MKITNIKIRKAYENGKLKAYVDITFDNCLVVHNIKIIQKDEELILAMPSRKTAKGEYKDIVHPINTQFREVLHNEIMRKYTADCANED
ncbi:MAG: septation regulator SpoVG [Treponema sp.]|nr:septation regulator SpoVG [Treponema sp.]